MIFDPYIKLLDIYYGGKCNLSCHQCDTRSDLTKSTENDPELSTILEGITLTRDKFQVDLYSVIGGEPLLYLEKIDLILAHIRKIDPKAKIQFSTNGTLLSKKLDAVAELMLKHSCSLFVCNHFAAFDTNMTEKITESVNQLVKKLNLEKGDANNFFKEFIGLDNPRKDPYMAKWIKERKEYFLGEQPNDHYYYNNDMFVHFRPQTTFHKNYVMINGKPKPHMTGLPHVSFKDGCSSVLCNFLIGKKLYKCAALGTLKQLLTHYDCLDDLDWQKYLNYEYLDLETCEYIDITKFHLGKFCSIAECDMCGTQEFNRTKEHVIHIQTS